VSDLVQTAARLFNETRHTADIALIELGYLLKKVNDLRMWRGDSGRIQLLLKSVPLFEQPVKCLKV